MVPQDTYSSLMSQQKQLYSPVVNQLSNLDQELQSIIANPNLSTDSKYQQYANVFGRYQTLRNQLHPQIPAQAAAVNSQEPPPVVQLPVEEQQLLNGLPQTIRRKGRILIDHIKKQPRHFQFQQSGELMFDGKPIPASSFVDLVHHATRTRPTLGPPVGFEHFLNLLDETNVPKEALSDGIVKRKPLTIAKRKPLVVGTAFPPAAASQVRKKIGIPVKSRPARIRKSPQKYGQWKKY